MGGPFGLLGVHQRAEAGAGRTRRWWCRSHLGRPRGRPRPTCRGRRADAAAPPQGLSRPWSALCEPPDPSWADTTARPGWIRPRGRHGPESRWAASLLAQRVTEHHAEAEDTVEARPGPLHAGGRADALAPRGVSRPGPDVGGAGGRTAAWTAVGGAGGGRTVLSPSRGEDDARQVAVVDVP
ncbi:beta-xylosidase family glycoside hydrolase [Streptomyces sp. NPDC002486]